MLEENEETAIDVSLGFATDRKQLTLNIEALEEMSPEDWAKTLRALADTVEESGESIYEYSDSDSHYFN
jgi:hypothetical protein